MVRWVVDDVTPGGQSKLVRDMMSNLEIRYDEADVDAQSNNAEGQTQAMPATTGNEHEQGNAVPAATDSTIQASGEWKE